MPGAAPEPTTPAGRERVYLETYGCTTNLGDSRTMAGILHAAGHELVDDPDAADIVVVNTCTVVDTTESRIAHRLRTFHEQGKRVVAAGCLAAARPEAIHAVAPDAPLVTPRTLHDIAAAATGTPRSETYRPKTRLPRLLGGNGTDAVIQLSEGCLFHCAYCSTKQARGDQTSYPADELVADVRDAVNAGATLVQLTAQDTSGYGFDDGHDLPALVRRITDIGGDFRLRIGMMHPRTAHRTQDALLHAMAHDKVHKFLHLPIQSGSPRMLKAMNRGHRLAEFWDVVDAFRARFPDGTVSTDLIVAYPGETDHDHAETMALVSRLGAEHVNVTRFSARPGTHAKSLPGRVPTHVAKARSRELTAHCLDVMAARMARFVGRTWDLQVTEPGKKPDSMIARGPGHQPVVIERPADAVPIGSRIPARIVASRGTYLVAEPLGPATPMAKPVPPGKRAHPVLPVLPVLP